MNRIQGRTGIVLILVIALLAGMVFFTGEFLVKGDDWVIFSGSPHVYSSGNIGCGTVTDRDGNLLLDMTSGRVYSDDLALRCSTIHWLGDRSGYISAPALPYHSEAMAGYDVLNGLYSYANAGGTAELTLSAAVQKVALEQMGDRKGTIAVYNYKTGQLICAVTTPNYDPDNVPDIAEDTTGAYEGVYVNRFTQSVYIPGSIFKTVTAAAALEAIDGIEDMTFECTGKYTIDGGKVTCESKHGTLTLKKALMKSCNCAFAQIAELLGAETLQYYVDQFQITESVAFDGITTASGGFDPGEDMLQTAWSAVGQGNDQINACRFLTYMGTVASGGNGVEPYLVEKITVGGKTTYEATASATGRIMSTETAKTLQEYMRNNVENNYGDENFPGLTVCAKTGTAQVEGSEKSTATFCGFTLDEEYPFAFIAVVENSGYGNKVCIPIMSAVLAACWEVYAAE